jgi:glycosyltransferase involved in cell wall biosynthesis
MLKLSITGPGFLWGTLLKDKRLILSLVHDLTFGGDTTRVLALARTIDTDRFEYMLVCVNRPDAEADSRKGSMIQELVEAGVKVISLGKAQGRTKPLSLRPDQVVRTGTVFWEVLRQLKRIIQDYQVDVIDAHLLVPNIVGSLCGVLTGVPTAITLYGTNVLPDELQVTATDAQFSLQERQIPRGKLLMWRTPVRLSLELADVVITDSQARRRDIEAWKTWMKAPVQVIPNGIFRPVPMRTSADIRKEFGLPKSDEMRVIGQISRLIPSKGQRVLLEAARIVLSSKPETFFLIVGYDAPGAYKASLEQEAIRLGISERVRILAYPGHIGDVWGVIDIHAHASLHDSLPNAIIEGMSLGRPAVVTSTGGIPELVENEITGLIVPPGNPPALAEALLRFLHENGTARRLGEAARMRYEAQYCPEIMTRQVEDLFTDLIARRRSRFFYGRRSSSPARRAT